MSKLKRAFKYFDRYAKGLGPVYKHSGSFETSCGGICSIISFFILAWWLITEIYSQFINPSYDISQSTGLVQSHDGTFDDWQLAQDALIITARIQTTDSSIS